ncbi:MAG: hypothetical protein WAT79_13780 [Saprospiraceae bacterium]
MLKFGWGPKNKHRTFEYSPRFYDPDKEELDERIKLLEEKYGEKLELDAEKMKMRIKKGLRTKNYGNTGMRKNAEKTAAYRRLIIIIVLVAIFVFIMQFEKFIHFLNYFE